MMLTTFLFVEASAACWADASSVVDVDGEVLGVRFPIVHAKGVALEDELARAHHASGHLQWAVELELQGEEHERQKTLH